MEKLNFNEALFERIKKIKFQYEGKIPESLKHYYNDILKGNDLDMFMQAYSLSKKELIKYARICKVMEIYKDVFDLIEVIKQELSELEKDEIIEYQEVINELQSEGETILDDIESSLEDDIDIVKRNNLIIYSPFIDESYERTINAHSGKEEQTQKRVANLIKKINNIDYQSLRKKGLMHQILETDSKNPCYIDGNAFERASNGATKLNFIRIPISEKNKEVIKRTFNTDFDTFYLIVSYGDFQNEGIDEKRFYNKVYLEFKKYYQEILNIINLFKIFL